MRDSRFHQSLIAEWFGTTVFVLFLVLTIMSAPGNAVQIGLVAGFTFFALTYMLYSTSGAHLNPAVTVGIFFCCFILSRRAGPIKAP